MTTLMFGVLAILINLTSQASINLSPYKDGCLHRNCNLKFLEKEQYITTFEDNAPDKRMIYKSLKSEPELLLMMSKDDRDYSKSKKTSNKSKKLKKIRNKNINKYNKKLFLPFGIYGLIRGAMMVATIVNLVTK